MANGIVSAGLLWWTAFAQPSGPARRCSGIAADDDRDAAPGWKRPAEDVLERHETSVKACALLAPQGAHRLHVLVGARPAVVEGHTERREILGQPAQAHAPD